MTGSGSGSGAQETLLRWGDSGFVSVSEPGELRAADSWLVAGGRVRAFDLHERRFGRACAGLGGISRERTREFLLAAMARIPARGRWFPRAELVSVPGSGSGSGSGELALQLRIRPAPAQGHSVRLWLSPCSDTRTNPQVKGVDLGWLAALRRSAVDAGADEAVLLSASGHVLEGATTSILWWSGDTLCAPPEAGRLLPGITRELLLDAADAAGVTVSFRDSSPTELAGMEVWAVNALHGIRPVTAWIGTGITAGPSHRALRWQVYLDELSREVRPGPAEAVR